MTDHLHPATGSRGREPLPATALDQMFTSARTRNAWLPRPVDEDILKRLYDLVRWAPTAANTNPARFVFVTSAEGKQRVKPHLSPGNVDKTMSAPCCVIIARDTRFYEFMPQLFPSRDFRARFETNPEVAAETSTRSTTLQAGYFILAARALGLDTGPMSGFNAATLDADFFPDGSWKSNLICNIGYGSDDNLFERNPRLDFGQACRIM